MSNEPGRSPKPTRRTILSAGVAALAGVVPLANRASAADDDRDRYGGWTGRRFQPTGFFRTELDGERWWLVTPEGNAFISLGINHYHYGWWLAPYNRDHWLKAFGAESGRDPRFVEGFRREAASDMAHLGLNTIGIHHEPPILLEPTPIAPYVARYDPVDIPHWKNPGPDKFLDIFSPAFETHCDAVARQRVLPLVDDPFVLGFAMTDCPILTDHDARARDQTTFGALRPRAAPTWPRVLRNLGPDAPGKRAWVDAMRELYRDKPAAFNTAYATEFPSWDALAAAPDWRPHTDFANASEQRDNTEFLRRCTARYYRVAKSALRRYDDRHLFLGDKINANTDTLDTVLDITARYTDLVYYQAYGRYVTQEPILDRWSLRVGKPFLNGDSTYSVASEMMPRPYGPLASDETERAAWMRDFAEHAIARPDFVGWHICGMIDTWKTLADKAERQHSGLKTPTGEFYPETEATLQDVSQRLYEIALGTQ